MGELGHCLGLAHQSLLSGLRIDERIGVKDLQRDTSIELGIVSGEAEPRTSEVERLAPRQRNLLRQRFLLAISAQTLATSYGVHRATVSAWIEDARKQLLAHVRMALRAMVAPTSLDSVVEIMGSAMEVSIRRLLDSRLEASEPFEGTKVGTGGDLSRAAEKPQGG